MHLSTEQLRVYRFNKQRFKSNLSYVCLTKYKLQNQYGV